MTTTVVDRRDRPLRDLRVSVTDRCNLRCTYCMPEAEYAWLPWADILSFEEVGRVVDAFTAVGVDSVRLTGGEPLLRRDLPELVSMLAARPAIRDLSMTTNGVLLDRHAEALRAAGLTRLTVSLDTLRPERFASISQRDDHARVLDGLRAAAAAGFTGTKVDTVILRGVNDDELVDLLDLGRTLDLEIRFIEYMDVGGATVWDPAVVLPAAELLDRLRARYGSLDVRPRDSAPAQRVALPDGTVFGIVASTTEPFCASCDRSRVTADGVWFGCLYARTGTDLRGPLRGGATSDELTAIIRTAWEGRDDQGAVDRLAETQRGASIPVEILRRDPHLEMHTRGG